MSKYFVMVSLDEMGRQLYSADSILNIELKEEGKLVYTILKEKNFQQHYHSSVVREVLLS